LADAFLTRALTLALLTRRFAFLAARLFAITVSFRAHAGERAHDWRTSPRIFAAASPQGQLA
jgi:hypothetical protein